MSRPTCCPLIVAGVLLFVQMTTSAPANPFAAGNVLVSSGNRLSEYTRDGRLVQQIDIPYGSGDRPVRETTLDFTVDGNCGLAVFNGRFRPFLSFYDPGDSTWVHREPAALEAADSPYVGTITAHERYVFTESRETSSGSGVDFGLLRFDLDDGSSERFFREERFIHLSRGDDGFLYGLVEPDLVRVYDPLGMEVVRTIGLEVRLTAMAVDREGRIFGIGGEDTHRLDARGRRLRTISLRVGRTWDIDVDSNGDVLVGDSLGAVHIRDENLEISASFTVGDTPLFVAFVEPVSASCDFPVVRPPVIAQMQLPPAALAGVPLPVQIRMIRDGQSLSEPVRFVLGTRGPPARFASQAEIGTLIDGGNSTEVLLETEGGIARIRITPAEPGEVVFELDDPEARGIVLQEEIDEDFEASDGGFIHGGVLDEWSWGRPTDGPRSAFSGEKVWMTVRRSNIAENTNSFLDTPVYHLPPPPARTSLEFWHWFDVSADDTGRGLLLASVDGGPFDWIPGVPEFRGALRSYRRETVDLSAYAGRGVRLRFGFQVDPFARGAGWFIDDFRIHGIRNRLQVLAPGGDCDSDGLPNGDEIARGTDPFVADSDGDGLEDGVETGSGSLVDLDDTGTDPLEPDTDRGGMTDLQEALRGLNPNQPLDDFRPRNLPFAVVDGEGFRWDFDNHGAVIRGTNAAFQTGFRLTVGDRAFPSQAVALVSDDGDNLVAGPQRLGDLEVTRDIRVSFQGAGFCRFLEVLRNPLDEDAEATVTVSGTVYNEEPEVVETSSGDRTVSATDDWAVVRRRAGSRGEPLVTFVLGASRRLRPETARLGPDGAFHWSYRVLVPARGTAAVLHVAAQSTSVETALEKARSINSVFRSIHPFLRELVVNVGELPPLFHRGDLNGDGVADVSDCLCILVFLFSGGSPPPCLEAADTNDDGSVDCSDAVFLFGHLFLGTEPPPDPGPPGSPCGADPDAAGSAGHLGCRFYAPCQ